MAGGLGEILLSCRFCDLHFIGNSVFFRAGGSSFLGVDTVSQHGG